MARPLTWEDPEAFAERVDQYFEEEKDNATWSGLALYMGFSSRDSLNDYKKKEGFSDPIKKALLRIEQKYEKAMMKQPAGAIFALKNFGWKDKQEINSVIEDKRKDLSKLSNDDLEALERIYSKIGEGEKEV